MSPRLQDNPETMNAIADSRHSARMAKGAIVVVWGVALLQNLRLVRNWPAQVWKFLAGVPEEERSGVPQGFRAHLTAFAMSTTRSQAC